MDWFQYAQATALALVAIFGVWIAYQQWRTAREKLRLDLFERRVSVFVALRKYVATITQKGGPEPDDVTKFGEAFEQAQFLFGKDVREFLKEVGDRGIRLRMQKRGQIDPNAIDRAVEENMKDLEAHRKVYEQMYDVFSDYLSFEEIKASKKTSSICW